MQNHIWSFVFRMASLDRVNEALADIGSSDGGENDDVRFTIDSESNRQYRRFNAAGTELIVRLLPPALQDNSDAITHFQASVKDLCDYALRDVNDSDILGITISNENNLLDKPIGISFRRKDQLSDEVICSVFSKVAQSKSRYNAMDRLIVVFTPSNCPGFLEGKIIGKTAICNGPRETEYY